MCMHIYMCNSMCGRTERLERLRNQIKAGGHYNVIVITSWHDWKETLE